jgi:predicted outer membrane repeat protein
VTLKNNSGTNGGAIHAEDSVVNLKGTVCDFNQASAAGGCVYLTGQSSALTVSNNAAFRSNSAILGGGAIVLNFASGTFANSDCVSNTAQQGNGGCLLAFESPSVIISNSSTITNNVAQQGDGGGVAQYRSDVTLSQMHIAGNAASIGYGGAFYAEGGRLTGEGVTLEDNKVKGLGFGAAGYMTADNEFSLNIGALSGNSNNEGCVCLDSQGQASGAAVKTDSVVCAPNCNLTINGNANVCKDQGTLAAAAQSSFVVGTVFSGVAGGSMVYDVELRDPYQRPTQNGLADLTVTLTKGAQVVLSSVEFNAGLSPGSFKVNLTTPVDGVFLLNTKISGIQITNSPGTITVTATKEGPVNLTGLWVVLALLGTLGIVLAGIFIYRKKIRRAQYLPIADGTKNTTRLYGGAGFASDVEEI